MQISIPKYLLSLSDFFKRHGFSLYVVGGYVRNKLLSLPYADIDVATNATPQQVEQICRSSPYQIVPIAAELGTVQIHFTFQDKKFILECTTFRKDEYANDGHHRPSAVKFSKDIRDDAFRRDFTINALYADLHTGEVLDPTGGINDLAHGIIRTTSTNPDFILQDDGLRILRLIRFAAELSFQIDPETYASAKKNAPLLENIANERIWKEFCLILMSDTRYPKTQHSFPPSHQRALEMLTEIGALQYIIPELLEGKGIRQNPKYHAFDVFTHNIRTCGVSRPIMSVRLASLLHDIAKPRCWIENKTMYRHELIGAQMSIQILKRLTCERNLMKLVSTLIQHHMLDLDQKTKKRTLRKHFAIMGLEVAQKLVYLREADFLGSGRQSPPIQSALKFQEVIDQMITDHVPLSVNEIKINGSEIAHIIGEKPSPRIGKIKHALWMHCIQKPNDNNFQTLRRLVTRFK